ncbi:PPE family protein, SVP subgroup [Mycobacterium paraterrae]|uniref:PPE domain-containing protein n=1 Tax=Mycobacterium paraterrae TaxID=577492 RepID=A0ABY3VJJ8_9MYCO|nr:PPE domain-containing protein [Mycobacterium paraterrae]UMB69569.1 PPE domain-containing protein [Mycobacterium paraterrae]
MVSATVMLVDFAALPPEINSARMYLGPGQGPLQSAAHAWSNLSDELRLAASSISREVSALVTTAWRGATSSAMAGTLTRHSAWFYAAAELADQTAARAQQAADAYATAFWQTVPPPVVAANRQLLVALIAGNLFGQNSAAIAQAEAQYAHMWVQDAVAMYQYAAESADAAALTPFSSPGNDAARNGESDALSRFTSALPAVLQNLTTPAGTVADASSPLSGISTILQTLGFTQPLGYLGPANTTMSTVGLANSYMASNSASDANRAILDVGTSISATENEILDRVDRLAPVAVRTPASLSATVAQANSIGGLSVPPNWATSALNLRTVAATSLIPPIADTNSGTVVTGTNGMPAGVTWAGPAGARRGYAAPPSRRTSLAGATGTQTCQSASRGLVAELVGLAQLRDAGILTTDEFDRQKRRILGE